MRAASAADPIDNLFGFPILRSLQADRISRPGLCFSRYSSRKAKARPSGSDLLTQAKTRFQSSFMLMIDQPRSFASPISDSVKTPMPVLGRPPAGP